MQKNKASKLVEALPVVKGKYLLPYSVTHLEIN